MIKLPRTLHIEGSCCDPGEVNPDAVEFKTLRGEYLVIEEKLDGTGVSLFFDDNLNLKIWHRGSEALGPEFYSLYNWADRYHDQLFDLLDQRFVLFGEWMFAKHTIFYDNLPCYNGYDIYPYYFLESDIFDRWSHVFLSTSARHGILTPYDFIKSVPVLKAFKPQKLDEISNLIGKSNYQSDRWLDILETKVTLFGLDFKKVLLETDQSGLMEGLYIKHENDRHVIGRYKYVRKDFVDTIIQSNSHFKDRPIIKNTYSIKV